MKNIIQIIVLMLLSIPTFAQQIPLSDVADVIIPKSSEKLDKTIMLNHSKSLFKHTEMYDLPTQNLYKVDDVSIAFWDIKGTHDKRSLEQIKSEVLELNKLLKRIIVFDATIKNIHNKRFFIENYQNGDACYYRFFSDKKNNKSLDGILEYKPADKEKATAILYDFLNKLKFKE